MATDCIAPYGAVGGSRAECLSLSRRVHPTLMLRTGSTPAPTLPYQGLQLKIVATHALKRLTQATNNSYVHKQRQNINFTAKHIWIGTSLKE